MLPSRSPISSNATAFTVHVTLRLLHFQGKWLGWAHSSVDAPVWMLWIEEIRPGQFQLFLYAWGSQMLERQPGRDFCLQISAGTCLSFYTRIRFSLTGDKQHLSELQVSKFFQSGSLAHFETSLPILSSEEII